MATRSPASFDSVYLLPYRNADGEATPYAYVLADSASARGDGHAHYLTLSARGVNEFLRDGSGNVHCIGLFTLL